MRISWRAKELVFVAQGKPPYIMAFGSDMGPPSLARPDLMSAALSATAGNDVIEAKTAGPAAGPADQRTDAPDEAADYKEWTRYLVWAVLTGGALFMSWIAWRLIRGT
jgi:hypothetical protein